MKIPKNFMEDAIKSVLEEYGLTEDMSLKDCVDKQIPKKLVAIRKIKEFDGYDMGNCPICEEPLDNSFYENLKYCFVCGQKIDWGDSNE